MLGGALSFLLNIFLLITAVVSLMTLFNDSDLTMTESKMLFTNWNHQNITFKDLIEKEFQLPIFHFGYSLSIPVKDFNVSGIKAIE